MNKQYLLTIVIPAYNVEKFIGNLLDLLIVQKLDDIEVIVINDGSSDKTADIAEDYAQKHDNIKFINLKENKGVSVARNTGIENTNGKFIQFLDADDSIPGGTLDYYRSFLPNRNNDIMVFAYKIWHGKKLIINRNSKYNDVEFSASNFLKLYFVRKIRCHICSQIYSKSFLDSKSLRFVEGLSTTEDILFFRQAFFCADNIYYSSNFIFKYNIRPGTLCGEYKIFTKKILDGFILNMDNIENLIKNKTDILRYANFFLAEDYVGKIVRYIRFTDNDEVYIRQRLLAKKYLLSNKIVFVFPKTIFIWILRFTSIEILIKIFRKK